MKKYIVAVTGLNEADEKLFIEFIRENNGSWWHRIENVWLITDKDGALTAKSLRDFLMALDSSKVAIVNEIANDLHWSAFSPESTKKDTFAWVHRNWTSKV
jgi:hypothetical protein